MNALLLIAHGSRRNASNNDVRLLAERIRELAGNEFDMVVVAFLELADPDIGAGVDSCVEQGATDIAVLPYFLAPGRHVNEDIPEELEYAQARHPGVRIKLRRHIGAVDSMPSMVLHAATGSDTITWSLRDAA